LRIGIIGCGIAGQAAAIALARDGHDVTVVERFAEAKPLGAGLLLQPSGLLALNRLGLLDAALRWGTPVARLHGKTVRGRMVMDLRYADIGENVHGVGIHRAALFDVLHDAVIASGAQIRLGFDATAIENPRSPRLVARDGREEGPFDLVLDCAGAHDILRATLGARVRAPLYPWGALWATCPDRAGAFAGELRQVYDRARLMIGILPIGRAPASGENSVSFFWSLRLEDGAAQRDAGLDALKSRVLAAWPAAAPILDEIKSFDALSLATYRDVRMRPAFKERVLAIGDAAHGTSPQLGQGANLALIDAVVLAHALQHGSDIDSALRGYVNQRRAHLRFYQWASAALTPAFQSDSRVIAWARDILLGPLGRLPGLKKVMRTTLAGMRKFPLGIYRLPEE
jgi:2-polyprenyl-6-methoxyphenol hydroxylase-like FAD-dependent oxidoreductase